MMIIDFKQTNHNLGEFRQLKTGEIIRTGDIYGDKECTTQFWTTGQVGDKAGSRKASNVYYRLIEKPRNTKIKLFLPEQNQTVYGSDEFIPGRIYKCIKSAEEWPQFLDCLAFTAEKDNPELKLKKGSVYYVTKEMEKIDGMGGHSHFVQEYHFVQLPLGTKLQIEVPVTETKFVELN